MGFRPGANTQCLHEECEGSNLGVLRDAAYLTHQINLRETRASQLSNRLLYFTGYVEENIGCDNMKGATADRVKCGVICPLLSI